MKCRDASEMINSYFDNKTDPMKDRVLAEHIKSCDKCRAELDFLNKYETILKSVKPVVPPDNFLRELHRKIELDAAENPVRKFIGALRTFSESIHFPLEAAGVLAVAVVIFFLYKPFYNETIKKTAAEYEAESPRNGISLNKDKLNSEEKSDRSVVLKDLPSGQNQTASVKQDMETNTPSVKSEDDNLAIDRENDFDSSAKSETKKAPSAEKEKSIISSDEKSYPSESKETQGAMSKRKDSADTYYSGAERLFADHEVYIISKDLADSNKLFYKIRVHSGKHDSLIKRLKENYKVIEKNLNRTTEYYESELFLKEIKK